MLVFKTADFAGTKLLDSRNVMAVFHAEWCPFCRSFLTLFQNAMKDKTDLLGAVIDISDTNNPLWETFQVEVVPTLVGFKNGEVVVRKDGVAGVGLDMPALQDALRSMEER